MKNGRGRSCELPLVVQSHEEMSKEGKALEIGFLGPTVRVDGRITGVVNK